MDVPPSSAKKMKILVNTNIPLKRPEVAVRQAADLVLAKQSSLSSAQFAETLAEGIGSTAGCYQRCKSVRGKPRPLLVFEVDGANIDAFRGANIQTASRSVDLVGVCGIRCVLKRVAEPAEPDQNLSIRIKALVMKDVTRSDEIGVFFDVIRGNKASVVNAALDAEMPGEIVGPVDAHAADFVGAVVGTRDGCSSTELRDALS